MQLPRTKADLLEEAGAAIDPVAAECTEELLRAVGSESQAHHEPQNEQR
jgi:hypothetical protein